MPESLGPAADRHRATIERALGKVVAQALADDDVTDILLDPNGSLWLDRHSSGLEDTFDFLDFLRRHRYAGLWPVPALDRFARRVADQPCFLAGDGTEDHRPE